MADYIEFSAKTKSEAITKACIELGTSSDMLDIQVISEGSSGFFGFGSKPAIIKVCKKVEDSEEEELKKIVGSVKIDSINTPEKKKKPESRQAGKESSRPKPVKEEKKENKREENKKEAKKEAKAKAPAEKPAVEKPVKEAQPKEKQVAEKPVKEAAPKEKAVKEKPAKTGKPVEIITDPEEIREVEKAAEVFLRDVFASMELGEVEITSKYNKNDGCLEVDFEGDDMGILIGKRGQTLDSLQYLTSLVVNKGKSNYVRVKLDTEDYRRRRKETLENLARGIAYKVKKTRKPVVLEPMNPYERRIIHSALQGNKFVETISEGEDPYRHVVVKPKRY